MKYRYDKKACGELNIVTVTKVLRPVELSVCMLPHMPSNPVPSHSPSPNMINLELMDLFDERFCKVNPFYEM